MPETCCCIPGCSNRGGHAFPSDQIRRKSWIHAIKQGETRSQSWEPSVYAVVCRSHFKESDYLGETIHGCTPLSKRLKKAAVPSLFEWTDPAKSTTDKAKTRDRTMVKKSGRSSSINLRNSGMPLLVMDCWEENLAPSQINDYKQKLLECQKAQEKVKEAHRLAQLGLAIVTVLDDPRKPVPQPTLQQLRPDLIKSPQTPRTRPKESQRPTSPDIIFIGESPPVQKTPLTPTQMPQVRTPTTQTPQVRTPPTHTPQVRIPPASQAPALPAVPRQLVQTLQFPGAQQLHRFPSYQQQAPAVQIQGSNIRVIQQRGSNVQTLQHLTPVQGTFGIGVKRSAQLQPEDISPKRKRVEADSEVNWVPLDEFYYGKSEGDPTYNEEKNEFRFKCWYCNKMLYNNIKAMMHIQGHIDSSKQQNIDLSDLTQCKHCYRQFDTPFEMQTHVEKVHMNNVNVLMCRICERDHQSRQALMTHMRVNHNACEMPYICQLCKFRSSMYSDVVDHFKKKHDSSQHILCLYCLKVFAVKFVSQGWGQTQTYYGHLLKHQSKSNSKKCTYCRLTFVNPADCKTHKKRDHVANQKGIDSSRMFEQDMMIKVQESGLSSKQAVKSLNAPAVSKVLDFGGTRFPYAVNYNNCVECKTIMGTPDHFRKHIECSMCRFATSCSIAYANHMMGFHSGQMTSLNLNIPWERPMKEPMHCLCGFGSRYGNKIANHLVYCTKRSCYSTKPVSVVREVEAYKDEDPRHKPGASLLDVLGLVKKKNVTTKVQRRQSSEESSNKEPSELIWKSSEDVPKPLEEDERQVNDGIPQELKGAEKWKTVKIKDQSTPSKASVFLGVSMDPPNELKIPKKPKDMETGTENISVKEEKPETKGDNSVMTAGSNQALSEQTGGEDSRQISEGVVQGLDSDVVMETSTKEGGHDVQSENKDVSDDREKTESDLAKKKETIPERETEEALSEKAAEGEIPEKEAEGEIPEKEAEGEIPEKEAEGEIPEKEEAVTDKETDEAVTEKETDEDMNNKITVPSPQADAVTATPGISDVMEDEDLVMTEEREKEEELEKECTQQEKCPELTRDRAQLETEQGEGSSDLMESERKEDEGGAESVMEEMEVEGEDSERNIESEMEKTSNEDIQGDDSSELNDGVLGSTETGETEESKREDQKEKKSEASTEEDHRSEALAEEDRRSETPTEEDRRSETLGEEECSSEAPAEEGEVAATEEENNQEEDGMEVEEDKTETREGLEVKDDGIETGEDSGTGTGSKLEVEGDGTEAERGSDNRTVMDDAKCQDKQQPQETGGDTPECEITTIAKKEEDQKLSSSTGSDSFAAGDTKGVTKSCDTDDKREKPVEDSQRQQRRESSTRSSESHHQSPSHGDRRSDEGRHGSSHHRDNRSSENRDYRSPNYNRYDRPQGDRGWTRQERHPHEDRDSYRQHGQSRHHHDDRHHYDRNRYDDRRQGHHDNRYGHHDNRSQRGHWRGRGGYRGDYRDYR
ncbi:uncharacterized protein LOC125661824 isoform X2 [Ostrea edulis]|uniref:uncharacterized protein LOC125661824 isoform X2 n=2 Tax=Ostrea edulis TaxID=37623 RepID=UPI0024AFCEE7|nr:uncharacterized protein LOC125661824 isoform X2 [Ostrea edulis]